MKRTPWYAIYLFKNNSMLASGNFTSRQAGPKLDIPKDFPSTINAVTIEGRNEDGNFFYEGFDIEYE